MDKRVNALLEIPNGLSYIISNNLIDTIFKQRRKRIYSTYTPFLTLTLSKEKAATYGTIKVRNTSTSTADMQ